METITGGGATERFERAAFLERVEAEYAELEGMHEIDASDGVEQVQARLREHVERILV